MSIKRERRQCLGCPKWFTIIREYPNRHAVIRFCPACRERVAEEQAALERYQAWNKSSQ